MTKGPRCDGILRSHPLLVSTRAPLVSYFRRGVWVWFSSFEQAFHLAVRDGYSGLVIQVQSNIHIRNEFEEILHHVSKTVNHPAMGGLEIGPSIGMAPADHDSSSIVIRIRYYFVGAASDLDRGEAPEWSQIFIHVVVIVNHQR